MGYIVVVLTEQQSLIVQQGSCREYIAVGHGVRTEQQHGSWKRPGKDDHTGSLVKVAWYVFVRYFFPLSFVVEKDTSYSVQFHIAVSISGVVVV